jgi:alpha-glucuronidase
MRCSSVWFKSVAGFALLFALSMNAHAEDGSAAWLRYAPIAHPEIYKDVPSKIVVYGDSATDNVIGTELQKGLSSLLGRQFTLERRSSSSSSGQEAFPHDAIVVQARTIQRSVH